MRSQKHVSRAPRAGGRSRARVLCIAIPDDRGDESFADDLNMGRGIVSGRVALLLRSTEIRPPVPMICPFFGHGLGFLEGALEMHKSGAPRERRESVESR